MRRPPLAATAFYVVAFFFAAFLPSVTGSFQFKASRVTNGLVALYTFEEGALNPAAVQSADQSGVNVLGNVTIAHSATSATWTSGRAGLHVNGTGSLSRAVSAFNVSALSKLLQVSQAVTIELWFAPSSATESGTIVGFGNWTARAHEPGTCGGTGYDMVMQQVGNTMQFYMLTNRSAGQCAQYSQVFTPSFFNYYAITVNATAFHTYLNSAVSRSAVTGVAFSTWNNFMFLMFGQPAFNLGSTYTAYTWEGDIFLLSVYTRALNQSEVQLNYDAGVPYSIPVALPAISWISVQQGAIGNLPVLNYTNYDSSQYSNITMVIISKPTAGSLWTSPGDTKVNHIPFAFQFGQLFQYQGDNEFSGIDSVVFAPNNSYGLGTSGVVNILVIAPPSSTNLTVTVSMMATNSNPFALSSASAVVISSLPTDGLLFQTPDCATFGAAISALSLVTSSNFSLIYLSTAASSPQGLEPEYFDSFLFQVQVTYNNTVVVGNEYQVELAVNNTAYTACSVIQKRYATLAIANRTCDDSLLFLYTFEEGQLNGSTRSTADISWQDLLGDLILSEDPSRQNPWLVGQTGLLLNGSAEAIGATSEKNATAVFHQISDQNNGSFCLEAWIEPDTVQTSTVFGFGTWTSVTGTRQDCLDGKNIAFVQDDWNVYLRVLGIDEHCEFADGNMGNTPTGLHHIVGCLDELTASVSFYVDAVVSYQGNAESGDFLFWPDNSRLMFGPTLDYSTGRTTWQGIVYLTAMYSRLLTAAEVLDNYNAGLPNNLPVPDLMVQTCTAQAGVNSQLLGLELGASDVDQELIYQLPYSNWLQPQNLTLAIVQLPDPAVGTLYLALDADDTSLALNASMLPVWLPADNSTYSLSFLNAPLSAAELLLPAYSLISPFASFSFVAHDGFANGPVAVVYVDLLITASSSSSSSSSSISSSVPSSSSSAVTSSVSSSSSPSVSSSVSSPSSPSSGSSSHSSSSLSYSLSSSLTSSEAPSSSQRQSSSSSSSSSSVSSVGSSSSSPRRSSSSSFSSDWSSSSQRSSSSSFESAAVSSSLPSSSSSFVSSSPSSSSPDGSTSTVATSDPSSVFRSSSSLSSSVPSSSPALSSSSSSALLSSSTTSSSAPTSSAISLSSFSMSGSFVSSALSSSSTAPSSSSSCSSHSSSSSSSSSGAESSSSAVWSTSSSSISSSSPPTSSTGPLSSSSWPSSTNSAMVTTSSSSPVSSSSAAVSSATSGSSTSTALLSSSSSSPSASGLISSSLSSSLPWSSPQSSSLSAVSSSSKTSSPAGSSSPSVWSAQSSSSSSGATSSALMAPDTSSSSSSSPSSPTSSSISSSTALTSSSVSSSSSGSSSSSSAVSSSSSSLQVAMTSSTISSSSSSPPTSSSALSSSSRPASSTAVTSSSSASATVALSSLAPSSSISSSVSSSPSPASSSSTSVSATATTSRSSTSSSLTSSMATSRLPSSSTSTAPSASPLSSSSSTAVAVIASAVSSTSMPPSSASSSLIISSSLTSSWSAPTSLLSSSAFITSSVTSSSLLSSSPSNSASSTAGQLLTPSQIVSSSSSSPPLLLSSSPSSSALTSSWSFASSDSFSPSASSAWFGSSLSAASSQPSSAPASLDTSASSGSSPSFASAESSSTGSDIGCARLPLCYTQLPASCGLPFFQRAGEQLALLMPFTEGESDAAALTASDFSCNHLGAMTRGADSSFWLVSESGLGLSGSGQDSRLVSDFSMQDVQNTAQGEDGVDGYSIELWLQPDSLQQTQAVFSIGAVYAAGSQQGGDAQLNVGDSLLLLQDGSAFSFVVQVPAVGITDYVITVDSPSSAQPQPYSDSVTHAFTPFSTAGPTLTQLVLVLNSSEASMAVYVNGQLAVSPVTGWDGDLSGWFTAGSLLSFAQTSSNASGGTWAGEVRLLAVYTAALSADAVYINWNASLPSAVPQPVSNQNVSWSRLHPSFTVVFSSSPVLVSISQLPWTGVVSVYNATDNVTTVLPPATLPLHFSATALTFTYAPPAGYNASYVVNITYTIASPLAPTVASNAACVFVFIPPVITPPLPVNSTVNVTAQVAARIQLTGTDEDSSTARANMSAAFIASLPAYGQLFQCDGSGGQGEAIVSMTGPGTLNADGLQFVPVTDSELRVWYLPAAGSLSFSELAIVNPEDSFSFRVLTKATLSACSGSIALVSHNNLQAFPANLLLISNEPVIIPLQAVDAVSEAIAYALVRAPERGQLQDALNLSVTLLTAFTLPVYYATSQDRYSGLYDREAAPLPDAFSFAALSPTGLLSVPAEVSVTFAPTLGPPLLEILPPLTGFDVVVSSVANFSAVINTTGLADANSTSWLCSLSVLPASATITAGDATSFSLQAAVDSILDLHDAVQFTAVTADANLLLSDLTFSSAFAGSFTVNLTVSNAADSRISASAALSLTAVPGSADGTNTDSGAAAVLPFNAIWLWITVGVLVALVVIVVVMRRQCGSGEKEAVLTNEEKHILMKAKQGSRLDTGVSRAADAGKEDADAVTAMTGRTGAASASAAKHRAGWLERPSFDGLDSKGEREPRPQSAELQGALSVLPVVREPETSHLGSRVDTELWHQFASSASLLPPAERLMMGTATLSAFEQLPIVSEDDNETPVLRLDTAAAASRRDGSQTLGSGSLQALSDTAGTASHLPAINAGGLDSGRGERPARLFMSTHSFGESCVVAASPSQSQSQTPRPSSSSKSAGLHRTLSSIFFLPSAAGLLASPRAGAVPAIFAPSPLNARAASEGPRSPYSAMGSKDNPVARARASHVPLAAGDVVPVNPMIPLNVPSPRYPVDVYNKRTRTRSSINLNSARSPRPGGGSEDAEAEVVELYAAMARQHPFFQQQPQ